MAAQQIIQRHPAPWRHVNQGGNILMIDAIGRQIELFTMLDFVVAVTAQMSAPASQEMPSSAAL